MTDCDLVSDLDDADEEIETTSKDSACQPNSIHQIDSKDGGYESLQSKMHFKRQDLESSVIKGKIIWETDKRDIEAEMHESGSNFKASVPSVEFLTDMETCMIEGQFHLNLDKKEFQDQATEKFVVNETEEPVTENASNENGSSIDPLAPHAQFLGGMETFKTESNECLTRDSGEMAYPIREEATFGKVLDQSDETEFNDKSPNIEAFSPICQINGDAEAPAVTVDESCVLTDDVDSENPAMGDVTTFEIEEPVTEDHITDINPNIKALSPQVKINGDVEAPAVTVDESCVLTDDVDSEDPAMGDVTTFEVEEPVTEDHITDINPNIKALSPQVKINGDVEAPAVTVDESCVLTDDVDSEDPAMGDVTAFEIEEPVTEDHITDINPNIKALSPQVKINGDVEAPAVTVDESCVLPDDVESEDPAMGDVTAFEVEELEDQEIEDIILDEYEQSIIEQAFNEYGRNIHALTPRIEFLDYMEPCILVEEDSFNRDINETEDPVTKEIISGSFEESENAVDIIDKEASFNTLGHQVQVNSDVETCMVGHEDCVLADAVKLEDPGKNVEAVASHAQTESSFQASITNSDDCVLADNVQSEDPEIKDFILDETEGSFTQTDIIGDCSSINDWSLQIQINGYVEASMTENQDNFNKDYKEIEDSRKERTNDGDIEEVVTEADIIDNDGSIEAMIPQIQSDNDVHISVTDNEGYVLTNNAQFENSEIGEIIVGEIEVPLTQADITDNDKHVETLTPHVEFCCDFETCMTENSDCFDKDGDELEDKMIDVATASVTEGPLAKAESIDSNNSIEAMTSQIPITSDVEEAMADVVEKQHPITEEMVIGEVLEPVTNIDIINNDTNIQALASSSEFYSVLDACITENQHCPAPGKEEINDLGTKKISLGIADESVNAFCIIEGDFGTNAVSCQVPTDDDVEAFMTENASCVLTDNVESDDRLMNESILDEAEEQVAKIENDENDFHVEASVPSAEFLSDMMTHGEENNDCLDKDNEKIQGLASRGIIVDNMEEPKLTVDNNNEGVTIEGSAPSVASDNVEVCMSENQDRFRKGSEELEEQLLGNIILEDVIEPATDTPTGENGQQNKALNSCLHINDNVETRMIESQDSVEECSEETDDKVMKEKCLGDTEEKFINLEGDHFCAPSSCHQETGMLENEIYLDNDHKEFEDRMVEEDNLLETREPVTNQELHDTEPYIKALIPYIQVSDNDSDVETSMQENQHCLDKNSEEIDDPLEEEIYFGETEGPGTAADIIDNNANTNALIPTMQISNDDTDDVDTYVKENQHCLDKSSEEVDDPLEEEMTKKKDYLNKCNEKLADLEMERINFDAKEELVTEADVLDNDSYVEALNPQGQINSDVEMSTAEDKDCFSINNKEQTNPIINEAALGENQEIVTITGIIDKGSNIVEQEFHGTMDLCAMEKEDRLAKDIERSEDSRMEEIVVGETEEPATHSEFNESHIEALTSSVPIYTDLEACKIRDQVCLYTELEELECPVTEGKVFGTNDEPNTGPHVIGSHNNSLSPQVQIDVDVEAERPVADTDVDDDVLHNQALPAQVQSNTATETYMRESVVCLHKEYDELEIVSLRKQVKEFEERAKSNEGKLLIMNRKTQQRRLGDELRIKFFDMKEQIEQELIRTNIELNYQKEKFKKLAFRDELRERVVLMFEQKQSRVISPKEEDATLLKEKEIFTKDPESDKRNEEQQKFIFNQVISEFIKTYS